MFTQSLMEVLARPDQNLSYANLFLPCREAVRNRASDQDPQFETSAGFRSHSGFIGQKADGSSGRCTVIFDENANEWQLNRGAIHGLSTAADSITTMEIYDESEPDKPVGTARTLLAEAQTSP